MSFDRELDIHIRARVALIVIVTAEEERAIQSIKAVCEHAGRGGLRQDRADGFQAVCGWDRPTPSAADAVKAITEIDELTDEAVFVLKDFHEAWSNAGVKRKLKSLAQRSPFAKKTI